jgi:exosortase A
MTSTAQAAAAAPLPDAAALLRAFRSPAPALLLGLAVLAIVFSGEAAAAWQVWMESTAYSHCLFVLPIALYLAWDRRAQIVAAPIRAMPAAALLMVPLALVWLLAERLAIMEGRQLVAMTMLQVLFLSVLGWRMALAMSAPLLYLYFLVPFGFFLTRPLQDFTAAFSIIGLEVLQIPHYADQYLIEIPEGRFYVAEACAGLRFLIASVAFGVLYGCLMYRSVPRRIAFVAASIIVPIIANGFRALGIVVAGHILGSAQAAAADHILYGWLFFSIVTLLLILAGLPFRQDPAPAPAPAQAAPAGRMLPAAAVVAVLAAIGPAIAAGLDRAGSIDLPAPRFAWTAPLGCAASPPQSIAPGAEATRFSCPQGTLTAVAHVFAPRANPAAIANARRNLSGELSAENVTTDTLTVPEAALTTWRMVVAGGTGGTSATFSTALVNGAPAKGGLAGRIDMARNSIFGADRRSVLLTITLRSPREQISMEEDRQMRLFVATFLRVQDRMAGEVRRLEEGK